MLAPVILVLAVAAWTGARAQGAESGCPARSSVEENDGWTGCMRANAPNCRNSGTEECWKHTCDCMDNTTRDTYDQYTEDGTCKEAFERCTQFDTSEACYRKCSTDYHKCICVCEMNRTGGAKGSTTETTRMDSNTEASPLSSTAKVTTLRSTHGDSTEVTIVKSTDEAATNIPSRYQGFDSNEPWIYVVPCVVVVVIVSFIAGLYMCVSRANRRRPQPDEPSEPQVNAVEGESSAKYWEAINFNFIDEADEDKILQPSDGLPSPLEVRETVAPVEGSGLLTIPVQHTVPYGALNT
ncbi:hypothetical protein FOCC_FOCC004144 [Frankliniella occidentalis]|uniref:Uncharacterized protein LOC113209316 n=1 Tax=Frankliniella occidentalis TaxID=133901 RepID=A0A6J1SP19_FRAOC|nr:uncharacterized protein LOC113209316 [Frankliniella occidentalis]KAE8749237.1 hypothetical protein FOCC_FOCC004144 [Frankliniella occidentalis]